MAEADVCAVIYADTSREPASEVLSGVLAQSTPPRVVLAGGLPRDQTAEVRPFAPGQRESALGAALRAGGSAGCRWLWLLDGGAVPRADALEALLAASTAVPVPAPLLLASKVVDPQGRLHPDSTPRHEVFEKEHSIDAVERRLVQLRTAAPGSVLVDAEVAGRFGSPRQDLPPALEMHEWSARVLRRWTDTGYLVPASLAVKSAPPREATARDWLARVRILASRGWSPTEKLWETFLVGRDLAGALARDQGRNGVGAPGFSPSRRPRRMIGITRGESRLKRR